MAKATTRKPAETKPAAKTAAAKKAFFVGFSQTGSSRRRSGQTFFPQPHVYEGEPTAAMREDRYIGLGKVEDYPDAPPVSAAVRNAKITQESPHYGLPEVDLDAELASRKIAAGGADYDGKVLLLAEADRRDEAAKAAEAGVDPDQVSTEGGPKE